MTFEERLAAAHQELASKGVWQSNYNPPCSGCCANLAGLSNRLTTRAG